jgi:hypothetical protein
MVSAGKKRWGWVFDFVTMTAVLVGLSFGAVELRQLRKAQESQAILELFRTVQTPEYIRATALILGLPDGLSADELRERLSGEDAHLATRMTLTWESFHLGTSSSHSLLIGGNEPDIAASPSGTSGWPNDCASGVERKTLYPPTRRTAIGGRDPSLRPRAHTR